MLVEQFSTCRECFNRGQVHLPIVYILGIGNALHNRRMSRQISIPSEHGKKATVPISYLVLVTVSSRMRNDPTYLYCGLFAARLVESSLLRLSGGLRGAVCRPSVG
jgi:hypothetical protein